MMSRPALLLSLTQRLGSPILTTAVRVSACNISSAPPPPPPPSAGGPPAEGEGKSPIRLRRPTRERGGQRGGGGGGGGRGGGGGGRGGGRRYENIYQPRDLNRDYVATSGTPSKERPHMISIFPGDFSDDPSFPDDDFEDIEKAEEEEEDAKSEELKEFLKKKDAYLKAQKERWMENAKPKDWPVVIDERGRAYGRGSRKTASARVWISAGLGEVVVNQKPFCDYFGRQADREHVLAPLVATETCGKFDIQCHVQGGGLTGQAGAVRLGVARALNAYNPDLYRPPLKFLGYLTRDPRYVERKVVGRVKARKRPQWVRR